MSKDYSTILLNIIATALDAHCVVLFAPKDTQSSGEQQEYILTNGIAYSGELKHEAVLTERDSLLGLVLRRREPLVIMILIEINNVLYITKKVVVQR